MFVWDISRAVAPSMLVPGGSWAGVAPPGQHSVHLSDQGWAGAPPAARDKPVGLDVSPAWNPLVLQTWALPGP